MIDGFICVTWDIQIGKQTSKLKSTKEKKNEVENFHVWVKTMTECWTIAANDSQRWSTT